MIPTFRGVRLEGKSPTSDSRKHLQVVNYFFSRELLKSRDAIRLQLKRLSSNTIVLAFPLAQAFTPGLSEVALILEPHL